MAWVRNNTLYPVTLPNRITIGPAQQITCDNGDITASDVWPTLYPLSVIGDLSFAVDAATEEQPVSIGELMPHEIIAEPVLPDEANEPTDPADQAEPETNRKKG